jgi:RDD family
MNQQKKLYLILSLIIAAVLLYSYSTFLYYTFKNAYYSFSTITSLVLPVIAIAGLSVALSTGFKRTALLRLFLCLEIFSVPFTLLFYYRYFTGFDEFETYKPQVTAEFFVGVFLTLVITVCSAILLWHLSREKKPRITFIQQGTESFGQFNPADKGLRFANRLIDSLVIIYFLYSRLIEGRLMMKVGRDNGYLALFLIEAALIITYYLLLEGIFNTTAGKCATNTVITDEDGNRPGFAKILGRTFARLIPFDALSFLGTRGWHDSLSRTYVVPAAGIETANDEIILDAELNQQQ